MPIVFICRVYGSDEDFYSVHTTMQDCKADLVTWCKAYWQPEIDGPMPDDDDKLIDLTFQDGRPYKYDIDGAFKVDKHFVPRGPSAIAAIRRMIRAAVEEVGMDDDAAETLLYEASHDMYMSKRGVIKLHTK